MARNNRKTSPFTEKKEKKQEKETVKTSTLPPSEKREQKSSGKKKSIYNSEKSEISEEKPSPTKTMTILEEVDISKQFYLWSFVLIFLFFLWFWGVRYANFLYVIQGSSLFYWDLDFVMENLFEVGGLMRLTTLFFVQFFYYPLLGGLILAGTLLILQWEILRFFHLWGKYYFLSFIPSCMLCIIFLSTTYHIYDLLWAQELFSWIFGLITALGIGLLCDRCTWKEYRWLICALVCFLVYPIIGAFALLGLLFSLLVEVTDNSPSKKLKLELLFLVFLIIPLFWYYLVFSSKMAFRQIFIEGFVVNASFSKNFVLTLIPYHICIILTLLTLVGFSVLRTKSRNRFLLEVLSNSKTGKIEDSNVGKDHIDAPIIKESGNKPISRLPCFGKKERRQGIGLLLLMILLLYVAPSSDPFFQVLAMQRPLEQNNWDELIRIEKTGTVTVRPTIMIRFLALFEKGELGEQLFQRSQYGQEDVTLVGMSTNRIYGDYFLYRFGLVNCAMKLAMNKYVSMKYSYNSIRILMQTALVNGDLHLARRYALQLQKTLFYRSWVKPYSDYIISCDARENGFSLNLSTEEQKGVDQVSREIGLIRSRMPKKDFLQSVLYPELILYDVCRDSDFSQCTPEMQEMILSVFLLIRSSERFTKDLDIWIKAKGDRVLPKHFREALLAFASTRKEDSLLNYPGVMELQGQYHQFMGALPRDKNGNRISFQDDIIKNMNSSYWFYYFEVSQMPYY